MRALLLALLVALPVAAQIFLPARRIVPSVGEAAFTPNNAPGLWLWVDANDSSTLFQVGDCTGPVTANGQTVLCWVDKSTNLNNLTGNGTPIYETNSVNGLASIVFNGTDAYFTTTKGLNGLPAAEIFIIVRANNDPASGPAGQMNGLWFMSSEALHTHYPYSDGIIYDNFGTTVRNTVGDPATSLAQWNLYNVASTNASWAARLNGVTLFSNSVNTVGFNIPNHSFAQTFAGVKFPGKIAEIIVYTNINTIANRNLLETYFRDKYNTP